MMNLSKKKKLLILLIVLVIFIFLNILIKNIRNNKEKIDYKSTNIDQLITESSTLNDKIVYCELNDIITKYINSYMLTDDLTEQEKKDFIDYKKYYDVLDNDYKKYLGKDGYYKKYENFIKNFLNNGDDGPAFVKYNYVNITNVYKYSDNRYLCKIENNNSNDNSCLGIELNSNTLEWKIFYIE